jgi:hypothetical protein
MAFQVNMEQFAQRLEDIMRSKIGMPLMNGQTMQVSTDL